MNRRIYAKTIATAVAFSVICATAFGGDFLIDKKEFKSNVRTIRINKTVDSLRAKQEEMIDSVENGVTLQGKSKNDPKMAEYLERVKNAANKRYYFAESVLKLNKKNARDSVLAKIDERIRNYFIENSRYSVLNATGDTDSINNGDPDAIVCSALSLINKTVSRNLGKNYHTELYTCAVLLSAWAYNSAMKPLWHKSVEMAIIYEDSTFDSIFKDDKIDEAIDNVFVQLAKLSK